MKKRKARDGEGARFGSRRRHAWNGDVNLLDLLTELLTENGWTVRPRKQAKADRSGPPPPASGLRHRLT